MTHRLASRACRLVQDRMTAQLRSATEQFDFAQAREYQALREETLVLVLAGQLTDSGVDLDEFADLAATSRIVRQAVDMATRWRSIPISIGRADVAGSAGGCLDRASLALSLHEIGALQAPVAAAAGMPPRTAAPAGGAVGAAQEPPVEGAAGEQKDAA